MRIWCVQYCRSNGDTMTLYVVADSAGLASQFAGQSIRARTGLSWQPGEADDVTINEVRKDKFGGFGHQAYDSFERQTLDL